MTSPKIIVGIPAHNEEKTISKIINSVLRQSSINFKIEKVIVYSDASTDNTNKIVKSFKNKKVELIEENRRLGKTGAIKQLIGRSLRYKVDFLIIVDADLHFRNKNVFNNLVKTISLNEKIIAVSGFAIPNSPKTFIEKVGYFGFMTWEYMISKSGDKELYFRSSDPLIIIRCKDFKLNQIGKYSYMHDEFYYLFAKLNKKRFMFDKTAFVYFNLPKTLDDYIAQMNRYVSNHFIKDEFSELGEADFDFSLSHKISALMKRMRKDFVVGSCYILIQSYIRISNFVSPRLISKEGWSQIRSTK